LLYYFFFRYSETALLFYLERDSLLKNVKKRPREEKKTNAQKVKIPCDSKLTSRLAGPVSKTGCS